ncbi:type IV secretory system conjugative DNA transfer family protein [Nocardioides humi]|uniref:type IV secretory system conjugative DNA transfer family protein n=1 Tax=Nocardioides humi TaxID=449461 RepID=UPI001FE8D72B|nr:type IV secretory system conjugative DNA transfer family protein [Nocardioides humi]
MSSPGPGRRAGTYGEELTNAALIGLLLLFAFGLVLRGSGSVAAFLTGTPQPASGLAAGLGVLFHPGDPAGALGSERLSPVAYWITTGVLLVTVVSAATWTWVRLRRHTRRVETDPRCLAGTATRHEVTTTASEKALLRRAGALRPSLSSPEPADVGYLLGTSKGRQVWASVEDSILLIGPPRSGKGLHVVINAILDAPGAVIATSTRPDNLTATLRARQRSGPVAVFDPQRLAEGVPSGMRWSPVRGCADALTAMIRATGLAAATGLSAGGVESGGFWEGKTRTALQSLLHAAALDHRQPAELFRWTLDPTAAAEAVAILNNHPSAATGWADSLDAMIDSDPRTRDSIWQGVSLALGHWPTPESSTP